MNGGGFVSEDMNKYDRVMQGVGRWGAFYRSN